MLISGAGGEGISLGDTTWEGVLDGHYNPEKMNQMEGKGNQSSWTFSQARKRKKCPCQQIHHYNAKTLGIIPSSMKTPDEIIYEIAERKDMQKSTNV